MRRMMKILSTIFVPYFVFVLYLVARGTQYTASMPRWVWGTALCYFVAGVIGAGVLLVRKQGAQAGAMKHTPNKSSTRTLKGALVLYVLIFLNAIVLVIRRRIPLSFAVPGITVDLLLIVLFLWLLARRRDGVNAPN